MNREIPGYYFDESRNRYFPLSFKRIGKSTSQCVDEQNDLLNHENKLKERSKRLKLIQNTSSILHDPLLRAFGYRGARNIFNDEFLGAICMHEIIKVHRVNELEFAQNMIVNEPPFCYDSKIALHNIFPVLANQPDKFESFMILQDGSLIHVNKVDHTEIYSYRTLVKIPSKKKDEEYELHQFLLDESVSISFYYHVASKNNRSHWFIQQQNVNQSNNILQISNINLHNSEQIKHSLSLGKDGFVIALGDKLKFFSWENKDGNVESSFLYAPRKQAIKSHITSLSLYSTDLKFYYLYVGYRDGSSNYVTMKGAKPFDSSPITRFNNLRSIVSMKPLNREGVVLISGIPNSGQHQVLMICDLLSNYPSVYLDTKFINLTTQTEILDVSKDGKIVCYGSKNRLDGLEDFELYYIHSAGNLDNHQNKSSTKPLKLAKFKPIIEFSSLIAKELKYNTNEQNSVDRPVDFSANRTAENYCTEYNLLSAGFEGTTRFPNEIQRAHDTRNIISNRLAVVLQKKEGSKKIVVLSFNVMVPA